MARTKKRNKVNDGNSENEDVNSENEPSRATKGGKTRIIMGGINKTKQVSGSSRSTVGGKAVKTLQIITDGVEKVHERSTVGGKAARTLQLIMENGQKGGKSPKPLARHLKAMDTSDSDSTVEKRMEIIFNDNQTQRVQNEVEVVAEEEDDEIQFLGERKLSSFEFLHLPKFIAERNALKIEAHDPIPSTSFAHQPTQLTTQDSEVVFLTEVNVNENQCGFMSVLTKMESRSPSTRSPSTRSLPKVVETSPQEVTTTLSNVVNTPLTMSRHLQGTVVKKTFLQPLPRSSPLVSLVRPQPSTSAMIRPQQQTQSTTLPLPSAEPLQVRSQQPTDALTGQQAPRPTTGGKEPRRQFIGAAAKGDERRAANKIAMIAKKKAERVAELAKNKKKPMKRGEKALRDIQRLQKSVDLCLQMNPFVRVVRDIVAEADIRVAYRFERNALIALQECYEIHQVKLLEKMNLTAIHAGRQTIMSKDYTLVKRMLDEEEDNVIPENDVPRRPRVGLQDLMIHRRRALLSKTPLQKICKSSILRMARRAGVTRVSAPVYGYIRGELSCYLTKVVGKAMIYTRHSQRTTIAVKDVIQSLKLMNQNVYF